MNGTIRMVFTLHNISIGLQFIIMQRATGIHPNLVVPIMLQSGLITVALSIRRKHFPDRCYWYPWGGWSRCQGDCGAGVQTRIRRCNGCVPGAGACQGYSKLSRLLKFETLCIRLLFN